MRTLKSLTEPNLVYGIVIGISCSIVGGFIVTSELFSRSVINLLIISSVFILGLILGSVTIQYVRRRLQPSGQALLPQLIEQISDCGRHYALLKLQPADQETHEQRLQQSLQNIRQSAGTLTEWITAAYLRLVALGTLFTAMGILISFAIFWATFLQVSKLEEQIATSKASQKVDIALSVASNYQILVNALIKDVDIQPHQEQLSHTQYRRIEATLHQMPPYLGIDVTNARLATARSSPEQTFVLQYFAGMGIQFPSSRINLSNLTLHRLQLRHADLSDSNLQHSDLSRGRFYKTLFNHAQLQQAILQQAEFTACELVHANLSHANLRQADLSASNLSGVNFYRADLSGADLSQVENWQSIKNIQHARISGITNAPPGFISWALQHGATR